MFVQKRCFQTFCTKHPWRRLPPRWPSSARELEAGNPSPSRPAAAGRQKLAVHTLHTWLRRRRRCGLEGELRIFLSVGVTGSRRRRNSKKLHALSDSAGGLRRVALGEDEPSFFFSFLRPNCGGALMPCLDSPCAKVEDSLQQSNCRSVTAAHSLRACPVSLSEFPAKFF